MSFGVNFSEGLAFGLNQLKFLSSSSERTLERLSGGERINRGADDPAGLHISQGMRAQIGGLETAIQNAQDDINLLRTAEGSLQEASKIIARMRDLSVKGANSAVLTDQQRDIINNELNSLKEALIQIGAGSRFGNKNIGSDEDSFEAIDSANITVNDWAGGVGLPPGAGAPEYEAMKATVLASIDASVQKVYGMLGFSPPSGSTLTVNFVNIDGNGGILATGGGAPGAMQINIDVYDFEDPDGAGPLTANVGNDPSANGFTAQMVIAHEMTHAILVGNGIAGSAWGQEMMASYVAQEGDRRIKGSEAAVLAAIGGSLTSAPGGNDEYAEVYAAAQFISDQFGADTLHAIAKNVAGGMDWDAAVMAAVGNDYANFAAFEADADAYGTNYVNAGTADGVQTTGFGWTARVPAITSSFVAQTAIGPDAADYIDLVAPWSTVGAFDYLAYADVSTSENAQLSIDTIDKAIQIVASSMALIGVQENKLRHIVDDLQAEFINLSAARSQIQDADMAKEISELTRQQILQQAATATVAQSNASQSRVLDLIARNVGSAPTRAA